MDTHITINSNLNPLAPEFVPQQKDSAYLVTLPPPSDSDQLKNLKHILQQLTAWPGMYNNLLPSIIEEMRALSRNIVVLKAAVDLIFQECVIHVNLRYNGARLCAAIDDYHPDTPFRTLLIQRCVDANEYRKYRIRNGAQAERLRGFAHFLAELILHLTVTRHNSFHEHVHQPIVDLLLDVLQTLLQCPEMDNLICVGKLLRMTGLYLEDYDSKMIRDEFEVPKMNELFSKIHEYAVSDSVCQPVQDVLKELVSLRANNWSEEVFEFEPTSWSAYSGTTCGSDPSYCTFTNSEYNCADEFGDDIANAYEEYLKETGQLSL